MANEFKVKNGLIVVGDTAISGAATVGGNSVIHTGNVGSYAITSLSDTLDSITSRGSSTSNTITVGGLIVDNNTLYVDSANNRVGIGTTSPAYTFQVGNSDADFYIKDLSNGASSVSVHIGFSGYDYVPGLWLGGDHPIYLSGTGAKVGVDSTFNSYIEGYQSSTIRTAGAAIKVTGYPTPTLGFYTQPTFDGTSSSIVQRMTITNTGNVGIGTTTPGNTLHVAGTSYIQGDFAVGPQANAGIISGYTVSIRDTNPSIYFKDQTGVVGDGKIVVDQGIFTIASDPANVEAGSQIKLEVDGSEKLRVVDTGNLLIGTTTDAGYKLDVNGTVRVQGTNALYFNTTSWMYYDGTDDFKIVHNVTNRDIDFNINYGGTLVQPVSIVSYDTPGVYLKSLAVLSGNSAILKLDNGGQIQGISGTGMTYTAGNTMLFRGYQGGSDFGYEFKLIGYNAGSFGGGYFTYSSRLPKESGVVTERLRLHTNGNFGIYNSNPQSELDVTGVITATGGNSTEWNTAYSWGDHSQAGYLTGEAQTLDGVTTLGNTTTNNITAAEIVATSHFKLQNGGKLYSNASSVTLQSAASNPILFNVSTTEVARIAPTGNLLVGTTTDSGYKLDVNGTARIASSSSDYKLRIQTTGSGNGNGLLLTQLGYTMLDITSDVYFRPYPGLSNKTHFWNWNSAGGSHNVFTLKNSEFLETGGSYSVPVVQFPDNGVPIVLGNTATANLRSYLTVGGYFNTISGLAAGQQITTSLIATANNDTLIGLDINPTFTNGAFTGVSNYALRAASSIGSDGTNVYSGYVARIQNTKDYDATNGVLLLVNQNGGANGHFIKAVNAQAGEVRFLVDGGGAITSTSSASFAGNVKATKITWNTDSDGWIGDGGLDGTFIVTTNGNERSRITPNGNVLIGTTTDAGYKLDINGTFRAQGAITATLANTETAYIVNYNTSTGLFTYGNNFTTYGLGVTTLSSAPSDDLNNVANVGFVRSHTASLNAPFASFGMYMHLQYQPGNALQIGGSRAGAPLYVRGQSNSTWSAWKKIWDETAFTQTTIDTWNDSYSRWAGNSFLDFNTVNRNEFLKGHVSTVNYPSGITQSFFSGISTMYSDTNGWMLVSNRSTSDDIYYRKVSNGTWSSYYQLWSSRNFTSTNITNWNTAYSWGNHATAGYLTSASLSGYATQTYVNNAVSALVDSAPGTLDTLNELAAALGDDPNFATTVATSIGTKWTQDNAKISNWDTAYSWGNHASAGYLTTSSAASTYVKLDGSSIISNTIKISSNEMGGTYRSWMTQGVLVGGGGSDGAYFGMKVIGNNDAQTVIAWGDDWGDNLHFINTTSGGAADGVTYMTLFGTENTIRMYKALDVQETIYATGGNSTQWNTAYSWGNHAGLYDNYGSWNLKTNGTQRTTVQSGGTLDIVAGTNVSVSYGAGGVVTINSTDTNTTYTAGTGLTLSGTQFSVTSGTYAAASHDHTYIRTVAATQAADACMPSTGYALQHFLGQGPSGNDGHIIGMTWSGTTAYGAQLWIDTDPNNLMAFRSRSSTGVWTDWNNVWHSGNFTSTNISNWNTAYGWGNHASAGYLTSSSLSGYATQTYVNTAISNLVDSAPGTLDTLNELAAALGDDPNFATTVTNSIATKLPLAGGTMSGSINMNGNNITNIGQVNAAHAIFTNDASSRVMYLRGTGNIIQFQDAAANNKWEIVGREGTFYIYKGDGTGSGYKYQIDTNGNHTITGDVTVSGGFSASGYNKTNWDTAYSWGDHALAGYATTTQLADYLPLTGGTIAGALTVSGNLTVNGTITENSSIKIKENVEDLNGSLEKVVNLRPVSYNKIGQTEKELGLIAEEVQTVYPEFVQFDENGEPVGVNYSRLTVALIGAVQELTKQVEELKNKING